MARLQGILGLVLAFCLGACASGAPGEQEGPVRLNALQFIGTHNSYHVAPDEAVFALMLQTGYRESEEWTAERLVPALSFTHATLSEQLNRGIRLFELDIHDDPEGGRFADPGFLRALGPEAAEGLAPVDPTGDLARPGFKVFHTVDTDVRSRCLRLVACLEEVRAWSDAHPGHLPIFIQIETKEGRKPPLNDAYVPPAATAFDAASWARLHAEIRSVFGGERLFVPADLRGASASVNAAVREGGWPPAEAFAGRVIFLLLDDPAQQDAYVAFTARTEAPLLFASRDPSDPHTAWLMRPDPFARDIRALVAAGFLVYTRADAHSEEPRRGDLSRAQAAMDSGAQLISTDYPWPAPGMGDYAVSFGGAFVRCNPVTRPQGC